MPNGAIFLFCYSSALLWLCVSVLTLTDIPDPLWLCGKACESVLEPVQRRHCPYVQR